MAIETTMVRRGPGSEPDRGRPRRPERGRLQVDALQRSRLIAAMAQAACEVGAPNATVSEVVGRAGVSRRTFYEIFADAEDCLLAAIDHAIELGGRRVAAAYDPKARWQERIRSGLIAVLTFLDEEPALGRLVVVESLAGGRHAVERRSFVLAKLGRYVDEGREAARSEPPSPLTGEAVVGAVAGIVHARMLERRRRLRLIDLTNQLMSVIVTPYLGTAAARRELELAVQAPPIAPRPAPRPPKGLPVRVTYRTMRVLLALGEHPGGSNREIARAAGISDQGQASKLLMRLEREGLIRNAGGGHARGAANAWWLTRQGQELRRALEDEG